MCRESKKGMETFIPIPCDSSPKGSSASALPDPHSWKGIALLLLFNEVPCGCGA